VSIPTSIPRVVWLRALGLALVAGLLAPKLVLGADNQPSAHNPCFDRAGLWPADVKKTAYYKQKWEPARLLVWGRKGDFIGSVKDAANWLENGKPAQQGPDEKTDVLFPDVEGKLKVSGPGGWPTRGGISVRHLTLGRGVQVLLANMTVTGNIWVRQGFIWNNQDIIEIYWKGDGDVFARNDGKRVAMKQPAIRKLNGASVETVGPWECDDGLNVYSGKLIIGPDSSWWTGDRHLNTVCSRGSLILMSGAVLQTYVEMTRWWDLEVFGELLAGTPDRPLEKDAVFPLSFKSRGRLQFQGKSYGDDRDSGLMLRPKARMAVYSADPAKARLVFRQWRKEGSRDPPAGHQKVQIMLLGNTELNGVVFDDFDLGGIEMGDPAVRSQWKNVFFGKNNAGTPDALFKRAGVVSPERNEWEGEQRQADRKAGGKS